VTLGGKQNKTESIRDFSTKGDSAAMLESKEMISFKSYQDQANMFVKDYILAESLIPYTSVIGGILACKLVIYILVRCHSIFLMYHTWEILFLFHYFTYCAACFQIYDLTQLIGTNYFKTYNSFSKIQRIEWNNR
jgi:hypothetical protein